MQYRAESPHKCASMLAESLTKRAVYNSLDGSFRSPFAVKANKIGKAYLGGKPDDTTVVVSIASNDS
jgi:hypothetical protein